MGDDEIQKTRRWFAEELRLVARVRDDRLVQAFATVPRERFVGPPPLRILSPWDMSAYWTPPDSGPAAVYHNVLIAYDETRWLNNGLPSLWAFLLDKVEVARGERVLHLGTGMGYYTAILAELVGSEGDVVAVEIDELLAKAAHAALAPWPRVKVEHGDGSRGAYANFDVIVASAGATHPLPSWLDGLNPGGRLVFPMTSAGRGGGMLLARRIAPDRFDARFLCPASFYEFSGARDAGVGDRLGQAFARDRGAGVRSIRTDAHAEDERCWLHGQGWCLSGCASEET
ncbi:protein-L-isoaspartate(D-aspartate) O-methyltransferase [Roseiarcus fermentans]|uniref:Protein-L-isoaspartate O-methyltransferase n=1 Tax=Roseiarcus fermentans TaxID=1473586 RepID=A0A366EJY7_9HYPH|nr:methyltransferase domain-containing protein [Roseiarcus fermentans]RBP02711.1 protein-L-isoaspartate(D-aspartate) O-methyltransferase [Roseiarcus fermentans]